MASGAAEGERLDARVVGLVRVVAGGAVEGVQSLQIEHTGPRQKLPNIILIIPTNIPSNT